eukprot:6187791-Pleurochrysis_carterae.AAC.2
MDISPLSYAYGCTGYLSFGLFSKVGPLPMKSVVRAESRRRPLVRDSGWASSARARARESGRFHLHTCFGERAHSLRACLHGRVCVRACVCVSASASDCARMRASDTGPACALTSV